MVDFSCQRLNMRMVIRVLTAHVRENTQWPPKKFDLSMESLL